MSDSDNFQKWEMGKPNSGGGSGGNGGGGGKKGKKKNKSGANVCQ